MAAFSQMC